MAQRAGKDAGLLHFSPPRTEEVLNLCGCLGRQYPFDNAYSMVENFGIRQFELGADAAEAKISGAKDQSLDARLDQRSSAHDTRLQGDIDGGIFESVRPQFLCGGTKEIDLRVRGRVIRRDGRIVCASNHLASENENGANRNFPCFFRNPGLVQGLAHI